MNMARKDERLAIAPLGEYYKDLLLVDAWINDRSMAVQANSLLCSRLQVRAQLIRERVEYLAKKRGISTDELWRQVLRGEAKKMEPDEIADTEPEIIHD